jgi:membrane protease YdiL (CAAX protease family)
MPLTTRSAVRRELATFLGVAYAGVLVLALAFPAQPLVTVAMMAVPTAAVGIAIAVTTPRAERRAAWAGIGLRRAGVRWFALAAAVPAAVVATSYAVAAAFGVASFPGLGAIDPASLALELLLTGTLLALGEEIGWRGYLLPRLDTVLPATSSALLTGLAHALFHLPALLLTGVYQAAGPRAVVVPTVVVTMTLAGVLYAWLRRRSGSVWPVALAHSAFNTFWTTGALAAAVASPALFAVVTTETGLVTTVLAAVVAGVLITRRTPTPSH